MRTASQSASPEGPDDSAGERPSKTRRKAESHDLQALGETLATWDDARLARLPLSGQLLDAIALARRITSHGARKRQMQLIGKLMRALPDVEPIRAAVEAAAEGRAEDAALLHAAERWREALVSDDAAATRFAAAHPHADLQQLRALVRNARRDAALPQGRAPRSLRSRPPEGAQPGWGAAQRPAARHGKAWRDLYRFVRDTARAAPTVDAEGNDPHA